MKEIFSYSGRFQWWMYTVAHGQLLIRRVPYPEKPTTVVDVLFLNVSSVILPTTIDDLQVFEGEISATTLVGSVGGKKFFIVRARDLEGYVVAGAVFHREWSGTHSDASPLLRKFPP